MKQSHFAGLLLVCGLVACSAGNEGARRSPYPATHDGRFGTLCYAQLSEDQPRYCEYSMFRLAADPQAFDGEPVSVTGFLTRSNGRLVLFPNAQSYEMGVFAESIDLRDVPAATVEQFGDAVNRGVVGVTVMGIFDAAESEANGPRLGALREIKRLFQDPRVAPRNGGG